MITLLFRSWVHARFGYYLAVVSQLANTVFTGSAYERGEFRRRSRIVVVACLGYVFATWVLAEMLQAGSYRALFTDWHLVGF